MKINFELIRNIIAILSTGTILLAFIISIISTKTKNSNYIEYTDLSKFFLNLYTLFLLILIFVHTIYPKIICNIFINNFGIISSEKGKIMLLSFIFIMYFGTGSMPQKIFGMVAFFATFSLFLSNLFFNCRTYGFSEEKKLNNLGINNSKNITITSVNFNNSENNHI